MITRFLKPSNGKVNEIARRSRQAVYVDPNPDAPLIPFARPVSNKDEEKEEDSTYTILPEENEEIIYDTHVEPESKAEPELELDNVVDIDPNIIKRIESKSDKIAKEIQDLLLTEGASLLISYDDATSYAEAALRDAMGISVDIDSSVSAALSHILTLSVLNKYMTYITLPSSLKDRFMRTLTDKTADDVHETIQKTSKSEKYSSVLKNLQARMNGKTSQESTGHVTPVGVVRNRSRGRKAPTDNSTSDDIHDYNEGQNKGVRFK